MLLTLFLENKVKYLILYIDVPADSCLQYLPSTTRGRQKRLLSWQQSSRAGWSLSPIAHTYWGALKMMSCSGR